MARPVGKSQKICKNGHNFEGRQCRPCALAWKKAYRISNREAILAYEAEYRKVNRDKKNEATRKWQAENPDKAKAARLAWRHANLEYSHDYDNTYKAKNKERIAPIKQAWREANRESQLALHRIWSKVNLERCREHNHRRRSLKAANYGDGCSPAEWTAIIKAHGNKCAGFNRSPHPAIKLERDHVIPVSQGGPDMAHNIQPLCRSCNARKRRTIAPGSQYSLFVRHVSSAPNRRQAAHDKRQS
jgi:hypothetical protein